MNFYLETQANLNKDIQKQVDDLIEDPNFPWYFTDTTSKKYKMFSHGLLKRHITEENYPGESCSKYFNFFKDIFLNVCNENNIDVNIIYRGCINKTWYQKEKYGEIHVDHPFPHKQFIWYLNEFTDAPTYIFDESENLIKTTAVGKNKINIFSSAKHAQGFCAIGEFRKVIVFTFN